MAKLQKDEILERIRAVLSDDTTDEALSLLSDVDDTFSDLDSANEWRRKYEENDKKWREKYRDRFFNGTDDDDEDFEPEPNPAQQKLNFDSLFKTKE